MGQQSYAKVLVALTAMHSSGGGNQKSEAHSYLENFQKTPEAWTETHAILTAPDTTLEAKLFATTTLKGKIIYDLDQLPRNTLPALRDSVLSLLTTFAQGPRPIRTQLCVCLANLAIQMVEWKNVVELVGSTLGGSGGDGVLEFLRVLPEEVNEGRKINLSEEDLDARTRELMGDNAPRVLKLLIQYSKSSDSASSNPHLLDCISSWLREINSADVVNSPLLGAIVNALEVDASFDAAVSCLCTLYHDTREVDESLEVIQLLYPHIVALQPRIQDAADAENVDTFKGLTRLFAEAGEAWVVLIARLPAEFRGLVDGILECCVHDWDKDAFSLTFAFWYEFKQMLTMDKYQPARRIYTDVYSRLVDVMITHMEFPVPESGNEKDLFDGDREQEDRFREFRHQIGDVLKDCCEVISVTECLGKAFVLVQRWIQKHSHRATETMIPQWQELEAPLFAMRSMGRMVSPEEEVVMKQVIPLMVQIPNHEKLQFQAIMALARYTEWTAQHPEFLQPQLQFVIAAFQHPSPEVVKAAALAFRFFGQDCRKLLANDVVQLQRFYDSVLDKLQQPSQEEITDGVAWVIAAVAPDKSYSTMKLFCDPILERLKVRAGAAKGKADTDPAVEAVAETLQLLTCFITIIQPYHEPGVEHHAVKYCQEISPLLSAIADTFPTSVPILERLCRCWRHMVLSYRTAVLPLLPTLAEQLANGFQRSRQGCFLWATDSVIREFASGTELVTPDTSHAVYNFFEAQAFAFLKVMNEMAVDELPDVIEDFFRLLVDALIYYHAQFIPAAICSPILSAAISSLDLQQEAPVTAVLHYLSDLLSYGTPHPSSSTLSPAHRSSFTPAIRSALETLLTAQGEQLVRSLLRGMMFSFPRDCLQDASNVMLTMFELSPVQTTAWARATVALLPPGSVKAADGERLFTGIAERVAQADYRKVRALLFDFTVGYRRRHVAPREGLGVDRTR